MPLYEFECQACSHRFEEVLTVDEFERRQTKGFVCPKCRSPQVEQLLHVMVSTSKKS